MLLTFRNKSHNDRFFAARHEAEAHVGISLQLYITRLGRLDVIGVIAGVISRGHLLHVATTQNIKIY